MPAQDALTEEELEAFLKAVSKRGPSGKRNLAMLTLMADSGLRLGEALALQTAELIHGGADTLSARHLPGTWRKACSSA